MERRFLNWCKQCGRFHEGIKYIENDPLEALYISSFHAKTEAEANIIAKKIFIKRMEV